MVIATKNLDDMQKSKLGQLLDKLINDMIEDCASQCDAIAESWIDISEARAHYRNTITSATASHKAEGAVECAAAVRELKW